VTNAATAAATSQRVSAVVDADPLHGHALITGATSGIGLAFARALAAKGCGVVLVARGEDRLRSIAEELGSEYGVTTEVLVADLSQPSGVAVVIDRLSDPDAEIEILVNNAGHGLHVSLLSEDTSAIDAAHAVMVHAVLLLGGAAGRAMTARGHGVIINVASVAALLPMGAYSAVKSWVATYSESLAVELAGSGVRVTTLMPGWVRTEFHERAGIRTDSIPPALWLDADRVANACLRDVARGQLRSVPSKRYGLVTFLAEHAPRFLVRRVAAAIRGSRS
jgi:short-subunit dehydrogenase